MIKLGEGAQKKEEKKVTSVSFMHVCVAENAELLGFFFTFLLYSCHIFQKFPCTLGEKKVKVLVFRECMYV